MCSVASGAVVETGGEVLNRDGSFINQPLRNIPNNCPVTNKELFGPVATIFPFSEENEAIQMVNDTAYGLGGILWTSDLEKDERLSHRISAGNVYVNQFVQSDPRLPLGGIKELGYGSELSHHGIHEFTNKKMIWIE